MAPARNLALEAAMIAAGLTQEAVAKHVGTDSKTVSRWIAGKRQPYLRNQYALAALLGVARDELWPDQPHESGSSDLVALYNSRLDVPEDVWSELINQPGDVDVVANDLQWFLDSFPLLAAELNSNALLGGQIRLLLADPDRTDSTSPPGALEEAALSRRSLRAFDPLLDVDQAINAAIRLHDGSALTVYRFGSDMLAHATLPDLPGSLSPTWHLRRLSEGGAFDRYLAYVQRAWQRASPVAKHRRERQPNGPRLQAPQLVRLKDARADAFRARARASERPRLLTLAADDGNILYEAFPPVFGQFRRHGAG